MSTERDFLATAPRGFADLLALELCELGALDVRERTLGVEFRGGLAVAYRACLESRVASRVFMPIATLDAPSSDDVYRVLRELPWAEHVDPAGTLACEWSGRHPSITHTRFGAQRVKDAICDSLRETSGSRPDVALERPSIRVHVHARGANLTVSLDLAGEGLHRRGYRQAAGEAPLRENVAAGMLLRAGWPALAEQGAGFFDPLCGSGTLVIEAAMIASKRAPGLERDYWGFAGWLGHDGALWEEVRAAARARIRATDAVHGALRGADRDARVLTLARENAARAGVADLVSFDQAELAAARPLADEATGLLCANPPYGVRLDDREQARLVHRELGEVLRGHFAGWQAAVLTGAPDLGLEMGLRAQRSHTVWNGALECRLLRFRVEAGAERDLLRRGPRIGDPALRDAPGARMFGNRLAKNHKRLSSWAKRSGVSCYRVYDADMPEYALAVDLYVDADTGVRHAYVQEYAAPPTIDADAARRRRNEALSVLPEVLGIEIANVHLRTRRRTERGEQYERQEAAPVTAIVEEGGLRFRVNFGEYLDTGLFLDHRITRSKLREAAERKRFLNLFAYTGTATVHAAAGRARATTSVDLSRTYLEWARDNLSLNGLSGPQHSFVQADCREWLHEAARKNLVFDLIFLDPPTFSNSKRMQGVHDVQRDHAELIDACMRLLAPRGLLVFSTNAQRFRLDTVLEQRYRVRDVSRESVPMDFERNPRIHRCYELSHPTDVGGDLRDAWPRD